MLQEKRVREINRGDHGPTQKAPGYDDTIQRDDAHDPAVDDPEPASPPMSDPDTEGQMGQPDAETSLKEQNPRRGE